MASFPRFKTVNLIHKAFEKAITGASTRAAKRARSEPAHNVYAQGVREGADTYISCSIFGTKTLEHIGHTKGMVNFGQPHPNFPYKNFIGKDNKHNRCHVKYSKGKLETSHTNPIYQRLSC